MAKDIRGLTTLSTGGSTFSRDSDQAPFILAEDVRGGGIANYTTDERDSDIDNRVLDNNMIIYNTTVNQYQIYTGGTRNSSGQMSGGTWSQLMLGGGGGTNSIFDSDSDGLVPHPGDSDTQLYYLGGDGIWHHINTSHYSIRRAYFPIHYERNLSTIPWNIGDLAVVSGTFSYYGGSSRSSGGEPAPAANQFYALFRDSEEAQSVRDDYLIVGRRVSDLSTSAVATITAIGDLRANPVPVAGEVDQPGYLVTINRNKQTGEFDVYNELVFHDSENFVAGTFVFQGPSGDSDGTTDSQWLRVSDIAEHVGVEMLADRVVISDGRGSSATIFAASTHHAGILPETGNDHNNAASYFAGTGRWTNLPRTTDTDSEIVSLAVSGDSTKTITLNKKGGGTITTTFTDNTGGGGSNLTAGDGIDITNNVVSVDTDGIVAAMLNDNVARDNFGLDVYDTEGLGLSAAFINAASVLALSTRYQFNNNGVANGDFTLSSVIQDTDSERITAPSGWNDVRSIILRGDDRNTPSRSLAGLAAFFGQGSILEVRPLNSEFARINSYGVYAINSANFNYQFGSDSDYIVLNITPADDTSLAQRDSGSDDDYGQNIYTGLIADRGTPILNNGSQYEIVLHGRQRSITGANILPETIHGFALADNAIGPDKISSGSSNGIADQVPIRSGSNFRFDLIDSENIYDGAITIPKLSAGGTPSTTTFLRGDNMWETPPDTTYTAGNAILISGGNEIFVTAASGGGISTSGGVQIVDGAIDSDRLDTDAVLRRHLDITNEGTDGQVLSRAGKRFTWIDDATGGGGGGGTGDADSDSDIRSLTVTGTAIKTITLTTYSGREISGDFEDRVSDSDSGSLYDLEAGLGTIILRDRNNPSDTDVIGINEVPAVEEEQRISWAGTRSNVVSSTDTEMLTITLDSEFRSTAGSRVESNITTVAINPFNDTPLINTNQGYRYSSLDNNTPLNIGLGDIKKFDSDGFSIYMNVSDNSSPTIFTSSGFTGLGITNISTDLATARNQFLSAVAAASPLTFTNGSNSFALLVRNVSGEHATFEILSISGIFGYDNAYRLFTFSDVDNTNINQGPHVEVGELSVTFNVTRFNYTGGVSPGGTSFSFNPDVNSLVYDTEIATRFLDADSELNASQALTVLGNAISNLNAAITWDSNIDSDASGNLSTTINLGTSVNISPMLTITANGGTNTAPTLVSTHGGGRASTYTVTDHTGTQVTTFTRSVDTETGRDDTDVANTISTALNNHTAGGFTYAAVTDTDSRRIDITFSPAGTVTTLIGVTAVHTGGDTDGNISFGIVNTREGRSRQPGILRAGNGIDLQGDGLISVDSELTAALNRRILAVQEEVDAGVGAFPIIAAQNSFTARREFSNFDVASDGRSIVIDTFEKDSDSLMSLVGFIDSDLVDSTSGFATMRFGIKVYKETPDRFDQYYLTMNLFDSDTETAVYDETNNTLTIHSLSSNVNGLVDLTDGNGNSIGDPSGEVFGAGYFTHIDAYRASDGAFVDLESQFSGLGDAKYSFNDIFNQRVPMVFDDTTDRTPETRMMELSGVTVDEANNRITITPGGNDGIDEFVAGNTYDTDDVVWVTSSSPASNNQIYRCVNRVTNASAPPNENWQILSETVVVLREYTGGVNYFQGQQVVVEEHGQYFLWRAHSDITNAPSTFNRSQWDFIGGEVVQNNGTNLNGEFQILNFVGAMFATVNGAADTATVNVNLRYIDTDSEQEVVRQVDAHGKAIASGITYNTDNLPTRVVVDLDTEIWTKVITYNSDSLPTSVDYHLGNFGGSATLNTRSARKTINYNSDNLPTGTPITA